MAILARLRDQPTTPTRAIKRLRPNPFAEYELRVGDLRVLYNVENEKVILNPAKLLTGLAALVERTGASIYEGTPVLDIRPGRAVTPAGIVSARWIVRATNDGITATVDPSGRVTERLRPFTQLSATMHYGTSKTQTPYTRHGDWFAWSCLVVGIALCGLRTRQSAGQSPPIS